MLQDLLVVKAIVEVAIFEAADKVNKVDNVESRAIDSVDFEAVAQSVEQWTFNP